MKKSKKRDLSMKDLYKAFDNYKENLQKEIMGSWEKGKKDISNPKKDEVLGGLISRQARLTTIIATDPNMLCVDIAQIIIRCMIETHITLSWLIKRGSPEDYANFVDYGLGQEKLTLEHLKEGVRNGNVDDKEIEGQIKHMEAIINHEIRPDFLSVDVGNWTKKPMRVLASESGNENLYNLFYTPFSSILHGSWNSLVRFNLQVCRNPLHKAHMVPDFTEPPKQIEIIDHVMRIMERSYSEWTGAFTGKRRQSTARKKFWEKIDNQNSQGISENEELQS